MTRSLTGYRVRPVMAGDVPTVVEHIRRVLSEFDIQFGVGTKTDEELLELPASYERAGGAFWIATADETGRLVGTAGVVRISDDAFELRKMYLARETRSRGVGAALLDLCVTHARVAGACRLVLDTVDQMKDAIAFYERHGFVRDDGEIRAPRCTRGYALAL